MGKQKYSKNSDKKENKKNNKFKNDDLWLDHFKKFNEKLKLFNLYLKDIDGDGNCLFRSISD